MRIKKIIIGGGLIVIGVPMLRCTDHRPVPMIAFHGTADPVVPYNGGRTLVGPDVFPSVPNFTATCAQRNGCGANPIESVVAADVTFRGSSGGARPAGQVSRP